MGLLRFIHVNFSGISVLFTLSLAKSSFLMTSRILCLCWCLAGLLPLHAQFQTVGSAASVNIPGAPADCYIITPDIANRLGAIWHTRYIDLTEPQDIQVSFYLGAKDANGADGMAFVMRDTNTATLGAPGGSFGYGGIIPSIGVELDTYINTTIGDSTFDHMSLSSNGSIDHNSPNMLTPLVEILPGIANLEDNQFHAMRITWDPGIDSFQVYVDCIQRIAYQGDLINLVFGGDSIVYWGFTGGTGGAFNLQQVCIDTVINVLPATTAGTICAGDTLPLIAGGGDEYLWQPSTGLSDSTIANPLAFPTDTITYTLTYKDPCGIRTVQEVVVNVIPRPTIPLALADTVRFCAGEDSLLDLPFVGTFLWSDGSSDSTYLIDQPGLVWVEISSGCTVVRDSLFASYDTLPQVELGPDLELCEGDTVALEVTDPRATGYFWQDGTSGPAYQITNPGLYWVSLLNRCGTVSDTVRAIYDSLPRINLGVDTTLCNRESYLLDAFYREATYLWQDGSTDTTLRINQPGLYWAETNNRCGTWRDSIVISYDSLPQVELGDAQERCEGDSVTLDATWPGSIYGWNTGDTTASIRVGATNTYVVSVSNICGITTDVVDITFLPQPNADLGPDTTLCTSDPLVLDVTQEGATYQWQDGTAGGTFQTNQAGTYWVLVERANCFDRDTIEVSVERAPTVSLGEDRLLCDGAVATLDASIADPTVAYQWNDGSTDPSRTISQAGIYNVTLSNVCGQAQDQVQIRTSETPNINLGGDQVICEDDSVVLNASFPQATYRWQDGSREATLLAAETGVYTVKVETVCGETSDQAVVRKVSPPTIDLGEDTLSCEGQVVRLRVDPGQGDIRWQDGSTAPVLEVRETGRYAVSIENACGIESDEVALEFINCECPLYSPNAFTPNGDLVNDVFQLTPSCQVDNYLLRVYDRWGRVVFQTEQVDEGWRGVSRAQKNMPMGVYVWVVSYQFRGSQGPRQAQHSGSITLIR
jgi:gliding motility-associated-like protein